MVGNAEELVELVGVNGAGTAGVAGNKVDVFLVTGCGIDFVAADLGIAFEVADLEIVFGVVRAAVVVAVSFVAVGDVGAVSSVPLRGLRAGQDVSVDLEGVFRLAASLDRSDSILLKRSICSLQFPVGKARRSCSKCQSSVPPSVRRT